MFARSAIRAAGVALPRSGAVRLAAHNVAPVCHILHNNVSTTGLHKPAPFQNPSPEEVCQNIMSQIPQAKPKGPKSKEKRTFTVLVDNQPGVLSKIVDTISARGFNIDSLVVGRTNLKEMSRITLVFYDTQHASAQLSAQLEDLVPVWAVFDYTDIRVIEREMLLVKVDLEKENADLPLRMRRDLNRRSLTEMAALFGGIIQDVSHENVTIELSTKPQRIGTFMSLLKPYGIVEATRSGVLTMARSPVEPDYIQEEEVEVDLASLPPS
ncbi:hypothetical protein SARC_01886 [Sphaeroforma arctica JP610]|uniref:ACT domain-containing protein n=1 Tax=Sphaeroforma arctica JP610 TaxID=667725 RepID=A0A0L0GAK6_9EUKA|nr:hypothetical protein SARC_01886 [Sphaeroforma arctica JP610]KNC85939.1 hypothetical protein SARC_01886 [Sphaeroforma arctica JP610]|eukprot:XP_014159841.1 hypothetical protein SARC_01886 [Sphaeroforma arctica JP610]